MKTLAHHVLIFDNKCPLCRAYTGAFVKTGMLDEHGREPYNNASAETCSRLDMDRARNEIALLNTKTGQVYYGIDSLFRIIAHAFPVFAPLFRFKPFRELMKIVYSFISYNRKVIIPAPVEKDSCIPDFNLPYRWAYIVFTWLVTSLVLTEYSKLLQGVLPPSHFFREFLICGGQIVFQSITLYFISRKQIMTYLGNMMTISFAGGLLLLLIMGIGKLTGLFSPMLYTLLFLGTAGLMFLEHWRRMKVLGILWLASISWVVYRLLVLSVIM